MPAAAPARPRSTLLEIVLLWIAFYASFTLFAPPLLDDADSVHAEVAREMLLRHDYVTLYANGIRYLEKAPLLYWSMAVSFRVFGVSAAAARVPLALTVLALALVTEAFARRVFRSPRAGLYAALILLTSPGIFLFTRITIPDAMVCLWLTLALYAFWQTEPEPGESGSRSGCPMSDAASPRLTWGYSFRFRCYTFAAACALNTLTKGLIGLVFPVAVVAIYLLLTRGARSAFARLRQLHPWSSLAVFLTIAAPWHILAGLANPAQGHPLPITFAQGHWQVPLPTDGNVHGWFWFYFMNEHLLRYLNLRVPHDYDTSPLWLFWGLCFVWLMPWSAFVFSAAQPRQWLRAARARVPSAELLLVVWAGFVLLFFSLSTRQEYYVLPALPAIAILLGGWLARGSLWDNSAEVRQVRTAGCVSGVAISSGESELSGVVKAGVAATRIAPILLVFGTIASATCLFFAVRGKAPAAGTDLATLLQQNPADYALSLGHFMDLNAAALGAFRLPLTIAALALFGGTLANFLLRRRRRPHAANLALAAGAFCFLLAAHLGLQTFAPVLTSQQLAAAIEPLLHSDDLIVIHGEYEAGSTLGFYLRRNDIHILEGRSSNLWYGSFFPDAPPIFETPQSIAAKWSGPRRIFLWQDVTNQPGPGPVFSAPVYVIARSGGKEIISNRQ